MQEAYAHGRESDDAIGVGKHGFRRRASDGEELTRK
jgi:hypothetical protein